MMLNYSLEQGWLKAARARVGSNRFLLYTLALAVFAEREGFEPSVPLTVHTLSKRARSATLTPLRRIFMCIETAKLLKLSPFSKLPSVFTGFLRPSV